MVERIVPTQADEETEALSGKIILLKNLQGVGRKAETRTWVS